MSLQWGTAALDNLHIVQPDKYIYITPYIILYLPCQNVLLLGCVAVMTSIVI